MTLLLRLRLLLLLLDTATPSPSHVSKCFIYCPHARLLLDAMMHKDDDEDNGDDESISC